MKLQVALTTLPRPPRASGPSRSVIPQARLLSTVKKGATARIRSWAGPQAEVQA